MRKSSPVNRMGAAPATTASSSRRGSPTALGLTGCLCPAAAPTFAMMALLTGVMDSGRTDVLCAAMRAASPMAGMTSMYVLMSVFHLGPWMKLVTRRHKVRVERYSPTTRSPATGGSGDLVSCRG